MVMIPLWQELFGGLDRRLCLMQFYEFTKDTKDSFALDAIFSRVSWVWIKRC